MSKPDRMDPQVDLAVTLAQWQRDNGYDPETGYQDGQECTVVRSHIAWGDTKS